MTVDQARLMTLGRLITPTLAEDQRLILSELADGDVLEILGQRFGEAGLYGIVMMMYSQPAEFNKFLTFILSQLEFESSEVPQANPLTCDNASLPQGPEVDAFSTNLLQPSIARKLYHPGLHSGYIVWGLGGPTMLVSHPFRGVAGSVYGIGEGTKGMASYLTASGYVGSYLFFDLLPGLGFQVRGQPAWLVWFAIIAAHSDIVIFIRERGERFTDAQKQEIRFTPDRVQKKIVEIPPGILRLREPDESSGLPILYVTKDGYTASKEKFEEMEAEHAGPLVRSYADLDLPRDVLVRREEDDQVTYYPADFPLYG